MAGHWRLIICCFLGGGGLLAWRQFRRQIGRVSLQDIFPSFEKQIQSTHGREHDARERRQDFFTHYENHIESMDIRNDLAGCG